VNGLTEWLTFQHAYERFKGELDDTIEYCLEHKNDPKIIDKLREVRRIVDGANGRIARILQVLQAESRNISNSKGLIGEIQGYIVYLNERTRYVQNMIKESSELVGERREEPDLDEFLEKAIKIGKEIGVSEDLIKKAEDIQKTGSDEEKTEIYNKLVGEIEKKRGEKPPEEEAKEEKNLEEEKKRLQESIKKAHELNISGEEVQSAVRASQGNDIESIKKAKQVLDGIIKETEEKKKEGKVKDRIPEDKKESVHKLWTYLLQTMHGIDEVMRDVRNIATVTDNTSEEQKILQLAVNFQNMYSGKREFGPIIRRYDNFLNMIGAPSGMGLSRMRIIREDLIPLLENIEKAFDDIKNTREQKEEEFKMLIRQPEKEKDLEKYNEIIGRFKKIEKLKPQFLVLKKRYEDEIHGQIIRWHEFLVHSRT